MDGKIESAKEGTMVIDPERDEAIWRQYMDDPDIRDEPEPLRLLYAVRRYIDNALRGMTPEEKEQYQAESKERVRLLNVQSARIQKRLEGKRAGKSITTVERVQRAHNKPIVGLVEVVH
jgi:hypothetical protein